MRIKLFSLLAVVFLATSLFAKTSGEELFKPCKACHNLTEDRLVGPGLAGVVENRDRAWLKSWITSSTKLIASGDADAKALFDEYKIPMQDYKFSDEDMETLINYMGGIEEKVEEVKEVATETASVGYTAADLSKAEKIFAPCKACHNLSADRLVGPGLAGVTENRDHKWLKSWITSSTKLIASGDADAKALFDEYKIPMQDYDFSDEDMELLIAYMGGKVVVEEVAKPVETKIEETETSEVVEEAKKDEPSAYTKAFKNRPITQFLFGLSILLLVYVLFVMVKLFGATKK